VIGDRQIGTPVVWVAESMKRQYAATPHYILVAGTVDSIVDRAGVPTVFLYTWEFELSRDLVSHVQYVPLNEPLEPPGSSFVPFASAAAPAAQRPSRQTAEGLHARPVAPECR